MGSCLRSSLSLPSGIILGWGYVRHFWGEIPGQETGTVVRYRVAAGGGGEEVYADDGTYYGYYVDNDPPPAWTRTRSSTRSLPTASSAPRLTFQKWRTSHR